MQQVWELAVNLIVGDIIIPAVTHPLETMVALTAFCGFAIWKA